MKDLETLLALANKEIKEWQKFRSEIKLKIKAKIKAKKK